MSTEENKIEKLDERVSSLERQVATVATKVDMFILEAQQQREDMRRLQDRQDEERRKHDAEMKEMNKKIDENFQTLLKQIHTNFIQTMLGVGAIMAAIGGLIIAALK